MSATLRQATRSSTATTDRVAWQTSHAAVSSNAVVNRDPGRAQGTAATTTPRSRHGTPDRPACTKPRGGVLERGGDPCPGPGPGHRGDHHPVLTARHPRRAGLQEHRGGAQVQAPPAPGIRAGVIARAAALAARAAPRRTGLDPHPGHQQLLTSLAGLHRLAHRVLDAEPPPPPAPRGPPPSLLPRGVGGGGNGGGAGVPPSFHDLHRSPPPTQVRG